MNGFLVDKVKQTIKQSMQGDEHQNFVDTLNAG